MGRLFVKNWSVSCRILYLPSDARPSERTVHGEEMRRLHVEGLCKHARSIIPLYRKKADEPDLRNYWDLEGLYGRCELHLVAHQ